MKKIFILIAFLVGATALQPAYANEKTSIAIIDTAIDTTVPELQGKVIHEVCLMDEFRCPNKQQSMEGTGSASLPVAQIYQNGFDHGTIMAKVAAQVNPNINIVFIRITPINLDGTKAEVTDYTVRTAMKWVIANKTKFNITAVSVSSGALITPCPTNLTIKNIIIDLQKIGVASVFAAGNNGDTNNIHYPACVDESLAIGWSNEDTTISNYSNSNSQVDFYTLGTYSVGRGTSASNVAFASYWAKIYKGNYQLTYDYVKSITKPVGGTKGQSGLFVDVYGSGSAQATVPVVTAQPTVVPIPVPVITPKPVDTPVVNVSKTDINLLPYSNERAGRLCVSKFLNKYVNHPEGYRLTCKSSISDKTLRWR